MARTGRFEHRDSSSRKLKGENLGENLAMKWSSDACDYTGKIGWSAVSAQCFLLMLVSLQCILYANKT